MAYQIEYAYTCHIGKVRGNNEDNFWCCGESLPAENQGMEGVCEGSVSCARYPALAVFDGMGGESCGEIAAFLASKEFGDYHKDNRRCIKNDPVEFLDGVCGNMNDAICTYEEENRIGSMGTTLAAMLFTPEAAYGCNLGDSRMYLLDENCFQQISTDHVLGNSKFGKAPLTQYLGIPKDQQLAEPSIVEIEYKAGNRYLLCSDGMTDMLSDGEIADILAREEGLRKTVELLLERVLEKGGRDNVTIVLCEIQHQGTRGKLKTWLESFRKENKGDME